MTAAEIHAKMLEDSPVLPGGRPYGCDLFGGDVNQNHLCKRVVEELERLVSYHYGWTTIEIGSGGGRWTRYLDTIGDFLIAVDGTDATRQHLHALNLQTLTSIVISTDGRLLGPKGNVLTAVADLVFSYDTMVHFHPQLFLQSLKSQCQALKPDGLLVVHHGSNIDRLPSQPVDQSGCWYHYLDDDVDHCVNRQGCYSVSQIRATEGFGSRVAFYRKDAPAW